MEYIDIVDQNGNLTGQSVEKAEAHSKGLWHLAVHIWIYNSKGEILLQKRSINKDTFPGKWDISVAGHISAGEDVLTGAVREAQEEIGLTIDPVNLKLIFIHKESNFHQDKNWYNNEFHHVYLHKFDGSINDLTKQDSEVDELRFISIEDFQSELAEDSLRDSYVGHPDYYERIILAVRNEF